MFYENLCVRLMEEMMHTSTKRDFAYWILTFLLNWFTSRSHLYISCKKIQDLCHCPTEWMLFGLEFFLNLKFVNWTCQPLSWERYTLNASVLKAAKFRLTDNTMKSFKQKQSWEKNWRRSVIRTLPPTLLKLFCKIIFNSKVIVKGFKDPDHNF